MGEKRRCYKKKILLHGEDILRSPNMQLEQEFMQHGGVSVLEHSVTVACACLVLAYRLGISVNERALVRGALLHDYFLYDWHERDRSHRFHGLIHARRALENAERDFLLGEIERNMILTHMFPLNFSPPRYRESVIICVADKICALAETLCLPCWGGLAGEVLRESCPDEKTDEKF